MDSIQIDNCCSGMFRSGVMGGEEGREERRRGREEGGRREGEKERKERAITHCLLHLRSILMK